MRAPVALGFELLSAESHGDASANVIAERHGAKEMRSAGAKLLTGGKGGRNDRAARVGLGRGVGIVGFVGMSQHAVGEGGFDGSAQKI